MPKPPKKERPLVREVYAFHDVDRNATKIGSADDSMLRLKTFHTAHSRDLKVAHIEKVPREISNEVERTARKTLVEAGKPKTREWLAKCTGDEAKEAIIEAHIRVRGKNSK